MIKSECVLDFCFIREQQGDFKQEIDDELHQLFSDSLHWYLDEKTVEVYELIVAEVRGMGRWKSEEELLAFLDEQAKPHFWNWLKGFRLQVYPNQRGCSGCGCS